MIKLKDTDDLLQKKTLRKIAKYERRLMGLDLQGHKRKVNDALLDRKLEE